ncbi:MFS transporter [Streptomyces hesseae]|uniref:MFS transporter n=1 Tax=Streptomyces hesseae TaxID=3075519 RepID=A0ABU2SH80_9ACTN|nr:MFS transporter [Streptomyces sp. DSM 40473]MDT0448288.1 MFS transporter [Streptomyces sp. DSM 40473]
MSPGLPDDRRAWTATPGRVPRLAPIACYAALLCGALAIASVTAAVPAVAADLEMEPVQTQWFAAAYQLTCGPLQLGVSHFADQYGARRILLVALSTFAAASLLATAATTAAVLIAARLLQGIGGAALSPVSLALLLTLRRRTGNEPHAVAGWVSTAAAASCLGPVLGGLLTSLVDWRAAFGALTLLATASAGCALHALGEPGPSATSPRQPMDIAGITLCTAAAITALITLTAPAVTASAPAQAATALLTVTLIGLLTLRTRRDPQGTLDAGLLRQAVTRRALLVLLALFGANSAFTFLTYFTLTRANGLSPLSAAVVALPAVVPAVLTARLAARRTGEQCDGSRLMRTGLLCVAAGVLLSGCGHRHPTPLWLLSGACAFVGCGLGLTNGSAMTVVSRDHASHRTAQAAATATTFAMLGGATGPAVAGAALTLVGHPPRGCGASICDALGTPLGTQPALCLLGLLTAAMAFTLTGRRHERRRQRSCAGQV